MTSEPVAHSPDREAAVTAAAQWYSDQSQSSAPVPRLKQQFPDLTTIEACEAIALAQRYRTLRSAMA